MYVQNKSEQPTRSDLFCEVAPIYKSVVFHERHLLPKTLKLSAVRHVKEKRQKARTQFVMFAFLSASKRLKPEVFN